MPKTYYYTDFTDDLVSTKNQSKKVPQNYKWIKTNPFYITLGSFLFLILKIFGFFYAKIVHNLKIEGKDKLKSYIKNQKSHKLPSGYYIFANHTQMLGDVFNPALYSPVHPYYVCDSSNLGIPILGPILPMVGALPIPDSIRGKKQLFDAISTRAKQGKAIVIYPEAHLWPYYTKIRPFETTAFNFPVRDNLPIFTATTTYQKKKNREKPRLTIFIDGPFIPDLELPKKDCLKKLHDQVYQQLVKRSELSDTEYITYQKKSTDN